METLKFVVESVFHDEEDFGCDEVGFKVKLNGEVVATFGDYYHDKGSEKSEAWIDGYCFAKGVKPDVTRVEVVDKDFWG
jgi:hypothetical protein